MNKILLATFAISLIFIWGCEEEISSIDKIENAADEYLIAEDIIKDIMSETKKQPSFKSSNEGEQPVFDTVYDTPGEPFPRTITIDYGEGIDNDAGNTIAGKIIMKETNILTMQDAVSEITLENFSHNAMAVEGSSIITNIGVNDEGGIVFDEITELSIDSERGTHSWESERVRTWTKGYDTEDIEDDEYSIKGTANGVSSDDTNYEVTTLEEIIIAENCDYVKQGIIEINIDASAIVKKGEIDFGEGECDDEAVLTINETETEISLD